MDFTKKKWDGYADKLSNMNAERINNTKVLNMNNVHMSKPVKITMT